MLSILFHFHVHLNLRDSAQLALWCALLVGFFTFFCTANLVPQVFDSCSKQHALWRGSIHFNDSGAYLTVTRTKTWQASDTALIVPVPLIPGSMLCPTTALKLLLRMVPTPDVCPLFTLTSTSNQLTCIKVKSLNNGIKHPLSLWIQRTFLVIVFVEVALHSHFSAVSQQSLLSCKETGDLTLTWCIYHCL